MPGCANAMWRLGKKVMVAGFLLCAAMAQGQETRGMIFGTVTDPSTAPVSGAEVIMTNVETNVSRSYRTNNTGYYEAALLVPGDYQVTVQMDGFKKYVRTGIYLPVRTRIEIDVRLELGTITERVSVSAEGPLLETDSATSGRVISNRELADLPMPINNPFVLTELTAGVQSGGGAIMGTYQITNVSNWIVKEQYTPGRVGGNQVLVDGVPNTTRDTRVAYLPQADTLQEYKVETSSFEASTGNTVGLNISMMTKSGTNKPHGSLSWQHWQQRLGGTPFFIGQQRLRDIASAEARGDLAAAEALRNSPALPPGHTNNYTATLGGPVILPKIYNGKDRLFFFFSYTGTKDRMTETGNINRTIPSLANREGDFSQLLKVDPVRYQLYDPLTVRADPARPTHFIRSPIPGNTIPKSRWLNPTYEAYRRFLPTPNNEPSDPRQEPVNNYVAVGMPWNTDYYAVTNRFDYQHSSKHRFFGRWTSSDWIEDRYDWTYESYPGLRGQKQNSRRSTGATLDWVYAVRPATVINVTGMYNGYAEAGLYPVAKSFKPSDVGLPKYLDDRAGDRHILPSMSFSGYESLAGLNFPVLPWFRVFSGKVDVMHIRGSHSLRAGFDMRQYYINGGGGGNTSGNFGFTNGYTRANDDTFTPAGNLGHSWAAFMMGLPSSLTIDTADSYAIHSPTYSWCGQDNWRLTSKLNLSLGLRLEYEQGTTERYNRAISYFDPNPKLPISDAALAAYARNPLPELPASGFSIAGGSIYAGSRGASRRFFQNQLMLLPRAALAYRLNAKTVIRGGYGVFYDTLNIFAPDLFVVGLNMFGYSRQTSTVATTDYGVNWLLGNVQNGVSPLADPFPVRSDGTRFDQPIRDAVGLMASAGRGQTYNPWDSERARQQRWRIGIQRQFGNTSVAEVAYAGMYTDRIAIAKTMQPLPEKYWADGLQRNNAIASDLNANVPNPFYLPNFAGLRTADPVLYQYLTTLSFFTSATIRKNRLLRSFPHVPGLTNSRVPLGVARSHSLEASLQRRFANGFSLNAGYTLLWLRGKDYFHNEFDEFPTERESNYGRPFRFYAAGIWKLPCGKGKTWLQSGLLNWMFGGWQLAATYVYQPGPLLVFGNLFYYGDLKDITKGARTLDRWFNTDNFERNAAKAPAEFHKRVFPTVIPGLRADSQNRWNANLQREFGATERLKLQFRIDALNLFNRSHFSSPNTDPLSSNFGKVTSELQNDKRWIQFQARLRF